MSKGESNRFLPKGQVEISNREVTMNSFISLNCVILAEMDQLLSIAEMIQANTEGQNSY